jgi:hypothetical protein
MAYLRIVSQRICSTKKQLVVNAPLIKFAPCTFKSTHAINVEAAVDPKSDETPRKDPLDQTFTDCRAAFKSKTTWEILRAYIVYTLCSSNYLVENNMKVNYNL